MDKQNPNNKPNMPKMPKFNMNWLYVMALIIAILFFSSRGVDAVFSGGDGMKKDYTTFVSYINKGYATRVVINKKESTLRMYVAPDHVREIFKQGVDKMGKNPSISVEIGSVDNLEVFLNAAVKQKKITGYSYENKDEHGFSQILISLFPWLLVIGFFFFFTKINIKKEELSSLTTSW